MLTYSLWASSLRIGAAHDALHGIYQAIQEGLLEPEHLAVAGCTPNDPSQHIAAPGVLRPHPIAEQEHAGPHMVRDDAHGDIVGRARCHKVFQQVLRPPQ